LREAGHTFGIALSDRNATIFERGAFTGVHVLERIPWPAHGSTPATAERARAEIAAARYDVALIVSEEPEAYGLARPIPVRVGFTTGWAKPLKSLWIAQRVTRAVTRGASVGDDQAHEADIVFALGSGYVARGALPSRESERLRPLLSNGPVPERRAIVVQLGAKWRTIGVRASDLAAIVRALHARGARLIASAHEREAAAEAAGDLPVAFFDDLAAWKAAIDAARVVVTPDTGAAHLAGMLGVPVVDVFPDADAHAQIRRWHPWAAPYVALTASQLRTGDPPALIERSIDGL
jgi:ADP-heptose:LPS heptosyltransferase